MPVAATGQVLVQTLVLHPLVSIPAKTPRDASHARSASSGACNGADTLSGLLTVSKTHQ